MMSCIAKLFNRMLLNRIQDSIKKFLQKNQNGFSKSRSTLENIRALRRLMEVISAKKTSYAPFLLTSHRRLTP